MSRARLPDRYGNVVACARAVLGLTQDELANRVGMSPASVSAVERGCQGRGPLDRIEDTAAAIGLTPGQLLALAGADPTEDQEALANTIARALVARRGELERCA